MSTNSSLIKIYRPPNKEDGFFKELFITLVSLVNGHALAMRIFMRNIKGQYRSSIFGLAWAFLPPLISAATWIFLNMARVVTLQSPADIPYPVFVLAGTLIWQSFAEAINVTMSTVMSGKQTMGKLNFNREALILAGFYQNLFNTAIKVVVYLPLLMLLGLPFSASWVFFPFALVAFLLVGHVIGLLLLPMSMLFGDVQRGIGIVLQLWFFITPVIYEKPPTNALGKIIAYNPATPLILNAKNALLGHPIEQVNFYFWVLGIAFALYFIGLLVFRKTIPQIIARIGGG